MFDPTLSLIVLSVGFPMTCFLGFELKRMLSVPFSPFTKFSKQYENSFKKSNNEISQQVGSFISNLLKLNARQLMNKKIKRKKNPAAASFQDPIHAQDPFQESFTASEIITQKNMSHLLTNYLSPTIEAIKRVPSK